MRLRNYRRRPDPQPKEPRVKALGAYKEQRAYKDTHPAWVDTLDLSATTGKSWTDGIRAILNTIDIRYQKHNTYQDGEWIIEQLRRGEVDGDLEETLRTNYGRIWAGDADNRARANRWLHVTIDQICFFTAADAEAQALIDGCTPFKDEVARMYLNRLSDGTGDRMTDALAWLRQTGLMAARTLSLPYLDDEDIRTCADAVLDWHKERQLPKHQRTETKVIKWMLDLLKERSCNDRCDLADQVLEGLDLLQVATPPDATKLVRTIRQRQRREVETVSYKLRLVRKTRQQYASNHSTHERGKQRRNWLKWGDQHVMRNKYDEEVSLGKLMRSAPRNAMAERYTIMAGMRDLAKQQCWTWHFLTLTAPPEYHPNPAHSQPSWSGATPIDAVAWLDERWARVRATLTKRDLELIRK